ncbi:MAG: hypothetical protein IAB19_09745 [Proteobacteria bacterium]|uniref:Uncharacterized protein n=1 Tax=Candidatus Avisuccinivibrio stercorigallinarum TaxID=2840704 RepID=A0A9D9DBF8_9GAMM|nr:hypothetical protein [Candidatus Avisuccinivibrio stercorigallinarum]
MGFNKIKSLFGSKNKGTEQETEQAAELPGAEVSTAQPQAEAATPAVDPLSNKSELFKGVALNEFTESTEVDPNDPMVEHFSIPQNLLPPRQEKRPSPMPVPEQRTDSTAQTQNTLGQEIAEASNYAAQHASPNALIEETETTVIERSLPHNTAALSNEKPVDVFAEPFDPNVPHASTSYAAPPYAVSYHTSFGSADPDGRAAAEQTGRAQTSAPVQEPQSSQPVQPSAHAQPQAAAQTEEQNFDAQAPAELLQPQQPARKAPAMQLPEESLPHTREQYQTQSMSVMQDKLQAEREQLQRLSNSKYMQQQQASPNVQPASMQQSAGAPQFNTEEVQSTENTFKDLSKQQEKLIQAAQYKPFEVNYDSASPNYDELARQSQARADAEAFSHINNKEVLPAWLTITLYLRQLVAAMFSHTTLSVLMPRTSMRFGPCYPSSMALPYLLTGIMAGLISALICWYANANQLTGGFCLTVYVLMTGLTSFRGLTDLVGRISKRRPDAVMAAAALFLPCVLIIFMVNVTYVRNEPFEGAIFIALSSMVSACFASSLSFDLKQDPVDSFGTMSLKGMIFSAILVAAASFLVLKPTVACSLVGLSLLLRLLIGQYLLKNNIMASRLTICAVQLLLFIAILFDLMFFALKDNILSPQLYELLSQGHLIAALQP